MPTWFAVLLKDLSSNLRRLNEQFTHLKAQNELLEKRLKHKDKKQAEDDEDDALSGGADVDAETPAE